MATYQNPAVTVDILVLSLQKKDVKILLIQRKNPPFKGLWAIPGGFLEPKEVLDTAASRELKEETGVANVALSPLGVFDKVDRDPRGRTITMAYWTMIDAKQKKAKAGSDAKKAKWFSLKKLPELAFDHQEIIQTLINKLKLWSETSHLLLQGACAISVQELQKILTTLQK